MPARLIPNRALAASVFTLASFAVLLFSRALARFKPLISVINAVPMNFRLVILILEPSSKYLCEVYLSQVYLSEVLAIDRI